MNIIDTDNGESLTHEENRFTLAGRDATDVEAFETWIQHAAPAPILAVYERECMGTRMRPVVLV